MQTNKSALSLALYSFQFDTITSDTWTDSELKRLERSFPLDTLISLDEQIENYFDKKDIDLAEVLPSIDKTVLEKEALLKGVSRGIKILVGAKTN